VLTVKENSVIGDFHVAQLMYCFVRDGVVVVRKQQIFKKIQLNYVIKWSRIIHLKPFANIISHLLLKKCKVKRLPTNLSRNI